MSLGESAPRLAEPTQLQITCLYSVSHGFELAGSSAALFELARLLSAGVSGDIDAVGPGMEPLSREERILKIRIIVADALINICLVDNIMEVSGKADNLRILADNIIWHVEDVLSKQIASHLHIEYFPDPYENYLNPATEPLIVHCTNAS